MRFWIVLAVVLVVAALAVGVSRNEKTLPAPEPPTLPRLPEPAVTSTQPSLPPKKAAPPAALPAPASSTSTPSPATTSTVAVPLPPSPSLFVAFTLEADDAAFYPNSVSVDRDQTVSLTFRVRSEGVRGGGLDIRSSYFSIEGIAAGTVKTVTFHAPPQPANITFNSFAQGTGNLLGTGMIVVR